MYKQEKSRLLLEETTGGAKMTTRLSDVMGGVAVGVSPLGSSRTDGIHDSDDDDLLSDTDQESLMASDRKEAHINIEIQQRS